MTRQLVCGLLVLGAALCAAGCSSSNRGKIEGTKWTSLAADVKGLESVLDEGFVWTHHSGRRQSRRQLIDEITAGTLRYSKLEAGEPADVAVYGDSVVVRGESLRQRFAVPGAAAGDADPFTAVYTATLVNRGGAWTLVALHTSRPPAP